MSIVGAQGQPDMASSPACVALEPHFQQQAGGKERQRLCRCQVASIPSQDGKMKSGHRWLKIDDAIKSTLAVSSFTLDNFTAAGLRSYPFTHPKRARGWQHRDVWVLRKCLQPQNKQETQFISELPTSGFQISVHGALVSVRSAESYCPHSVSH